ncbi:conserved hypothetical protein [Neospora caninum Liverpool]|uniref:Transmembrane protein n=1 Tax=Neospora caninum (strain Liverpool) TaxID=572307 RepID=F0V751_NEOCL|nr:conserved hypothetical protein [Neospora caninum Liverpool]CBZ49542.1 conserved hypothetical protein [Neospora caninum Liverpool]CEL64121.1 TPA: hypothetical protein BN1204_000400 [Neospora caninum Liverpool]|eukprot:XP_003879577.1 conserved hypothetical protein [Neospora caninum Liverpool]
MATIEEAVEEVPLTEQPPSVGTAGDEEEKPESSPEPDLETEKKDEESEPIVNAAAPPAGCPKFLVDRGLAEERARQAMEDAQHRVKKVAVMICVVTVLFIFLGVVLFFCFAPMFICLSLTFVLLGLLSGVLGLPSVCCKNRVGSILYMVLGVILILYLFATWVYYAYMFYRASLTAIASGEDKVNTWVEDTTGGLIPQGGGGIFDIGSHLGNLNKLPNLEDLGALKDYFESLGKDDPNIGALIGGIATAALLEECRDGIENGGSDYMDSVQSTFLAMASYGQMCNYSHHKILHFRKWEYSCKETCGFDMLAVGHKLKPTEPEDVKVLVQWAEKLSQLPAHQRVACYADSLTTACAAENTYYVYVILGVIGLFLLCGCCGCLCCLPNTLKYTRGYVKALKKHHIAVRDIKAAEACAEANGP